MTRLFYGSTVLAGLCAMTLVIGCGGSSGPKLACDGGNCGDAKKDTSGAKLDGPANPDVVVKLDSQVPTDGPAPNLDGPAPNLDGPAPNLDGPAPNLDAPKDTTLVNPTDARLDGTVTPPDAAADSVVATDAGPDAPVTVIDAAADAAPDLVVVTTDAADGAVDAAESDAAPVFFGDGGCEGDACHAYTFEGDKLDGSTDAVLAPGFTAPVLADGTGTWDLIMDGSNIVLEGSSNDLTTTSYAEPDFPPDSADQTIEVKVRFVDAPAGSWVRICGRFTDANNGEGYCLRVSIAAEGDAGATGGSMTVEQHGGGGVGLSNTTNATAGNLPITVGTWHTYRLTIVTTSVDAGAGVGVALNGYLDGLLKVSAADNTPAFNTGRVALGVRLLTADFDNLIVSTP